MACVLAVTADAVAVRSDMSPTAMVLIIRFKFWEKIYRQVSNLRRTLVDNNIVDHSDVVGASPVGAAPTTSSFST